MKYFSEKLNRLYDSPDACQKAEFEAAKQENLARIEKERQERELKEKKEKAVAERKAAAEKVETARKAMVAAQKAYRDELDKFIKAYGTYHFSSSNVEDFPHLFDVLNYAFNW